jgi:hypothetical protein
MFSERKDSSTDGFGSGQTPAIEGPLNIGLAWITHFGHQVSWTRSCISQNKTLTTGVSVI